MIGGWYWDEDNLEHLGHGLTSDIVEQVSDVAPKFRSNGKKHSASRQMIGPDRGGGMWTVCIVEADIPHEPDLWMAITGWPSDKTEKDWYKRSSK